MDSILVDFCCEGRPGVWSARWYDSQDQSRTSKQRYMRAEDRETASAIECDAAPQRRLDSVVDTSRDLQDDLDSD